MNLLKTVSPLLKEVCSALIDYAGMFPPAALSYEDAVGNYRTYQKSDDSWFLGNFVCQKIDQIPEGVDTVVLGLSSSETLPSQVKAVECKLKEWSDETLAGLRREVPVFVELVLETPVAVNTRWEQSWPRFFDSLAKHGLGFKLRFGGQGREDIPTCLQIKRCLQMAAERKLPLKCTQGLHHPLYTGEHGFLNLIAAAALALRGEDDLEPVLWAKKLAEISASGLTLGSVSFELDELLAARKLLIAVGSCSFEEPLTYLQTL